MANSRPVLRLDVGQYSHRGRRRTNNEDWLGKFQPEDPARLAQKGSLFLVADGVGGHQSGELASRLAVDQVIRSYVDDPGVDVGHSLRRAVESANAALYAQSERGAGAEAGRDWGTTLVGAVVRRDELWLANVGDSRAYLLRGGRLRQLSEDHSLFPEKGDAEPGNRKKRHVITRALGRKPDVEVDLFPPLKLRAGDRLLLCTDGLTTPLSDERIQAIAGRYPPQEAAEALVRAANEEGGPDNVSVILVKVSGPPAASPQATVRDILRAWTSGDAWRGALTSLRSALPEGVRESPTWVITLALLLATSIVIGLGFFLGLLFL